MGGKIQIESFDVIRKGGTLICIVNAPDKELLAKHEVTPQYVFVEPNGEELRQIGSLIDEGTVKCPVVHEMDISQVKDAHFKQKGGHVAGKLVLRVTF